MKNLPPSDSSVQSEFESFSKGEFENPPSGLSQSILGKVKSDLEFKPARFGAKLLTAHIVAGVLSLFVCQQFGIQWGSHDTLFFVFHSHLGHVGCMVACGALFMSAGSVAFTPFLSEGEARWLRKNALALYSGLALATLLILTWIGSGADVASSIAWLVGATTASFGLAKLVVRVKLGSRQMALQ